MAAAKKKAPAKKQKAVAAKKNQVKAKVKVKVKTKAAATKKAKAQVRKTSKAKAEVKARTKAAAKKPKVQAKKQKAPAAKKAKAQVKKKTAKVKAAPKAKLSSKVKTKIKKAVATPLKKKAVPQKKAVARKPAKKVTAAKKPAAPKKGKTIVTPVPDRFRGLKSMLTAKRDALLSEAKQEIVKYVSGENRQLVDTAIDEADWAAVEISEDINLKRLSAHRQLLNDVEECLRKVNEGTYGICEDCGEEISEKRLHVIPTATLCIDCKEQREKMAILEQETEI